MVLDDRDLEVWRLISEVPFVSLPVAIVCMLLNILLPGLGTCITACLSKETTSKTQLFIGLLQFLTSVVLIGWVWAIMWGVLIVRRSLRGEVTAFPRGNVSVGYS